MTKGSLTSWNESSRRLEKREEGREERRLVQYNLKAKNIITFALGIDEYLRVSNC